MRKQQSKIHLALAASLMLAGAFSATAGLLMVVLAARTLSPLLELPALLLRASAGRQAWRRLADVSLSEAAHRLFDDASSAVQAVAPPSPVRLVLKDVDYVATLKVGRAIRGELKKDDEIRMYDGGYQQKQEDNTEIDFS